MSAKTAVSIEDFKTSIDSWVKAGIIQKVNTEIHPSVSTGGDWAK
jgi:hypothetical protein